ncbi:DUF6790 family protein [Streptomyces sp. NPDC020719]|uniref:DUF6790 family protein n=1 Tax=Streptomyces sp. NPDC020719 TaxID=3154896 RepID=UPI003406783D
MARYRYSPSPTYYGYRRGDTWLNGVNDQVLGIGARVVRGTPRDSFRTLDTLRLPRACGGATIGHVHQWFANGDHSAGNTGGILANVLMPPSWPSWPESA